LSNCDEIQLRERFNLSEAITSMLRQDGNTTKSRYRIFQGSGEEVFFGVETARFRLWPLQTFLPDCAPLSIDIYLTENRERVTPNETAFTLRRPCTLTCCCINRPVVDVTDVETGLRLGSIREPFGCCDFSFRIRDSDERPLMNVGSPIAGRMQVCQAWGMCCPYPCGPCSTVDMKATKLTHDEPGIAHVRRRMPLCWNTIFRKEQNSYYKVEFDTVQAPEDKALLMALAVLIDFKYFHMPNNDSYEEWDWFGNE